MHYNDWHSKWITGILTFLKSNTFVERSASQNVSSVGKTTSSGTDSFELRCVLLRTLLAVNTPGSTHQTTAHVYTISSWQWRSTFVLMPLHIALLTTHVLTCEKSKSAVCPKPFVDVYTGSCGGLLPTQVRPVLSRVRPSVHSQRNEPWVLTQRPFVHTPGNTSHSLMSTGSKTFYNTRRNMHK